MALAGVDTGGLGSYSEATAADPTLIALRDKVEFDFQHRPAEHAGRPGTGADRRPARSRRRTMPVCPPATSTEQGRRLEEKFTSLAEPILGGAKTRDLIGEIGRIDTLGDLRPVMRMCGT